MPVCVYSALSLQALAREREEKVSLCEYELRIAQEDAKDLKVSTKQHLCIYLCQQSFDNLIPMQWLKRVAITFLGSPCLQERLEASTAGSQEDDQDVGNGAGGAHQPSNSIISIATVSSLDLDAESPSQRWLHHPSYHSVMFSMPCCWEYGLSSNMFVNLLLCDLCEAAWIKSFIAFVCCVHTS